jgi:triphosphoribosyl-dephospho-CoA synthase
MSAQAESLAGNHPVLLTGAQTDRQTVADARRIARLAVRSLYAELALYPKPGLVSFHDSGAHTDMNAATYMRSLFALRHYFAQIAAAGAQAQPFSMLQRLGIAAEFRMLRATGGVNTHRGAIFALGLLTAASGALAACGQAPTDAALRAVVVERWARSLRAAMVSSANAPSHGELVAARYRIAGARQQARCGFPAVFDIALPALRAAIAAGADGARALLHAFYHLLAQVADTNVLYRGGVPALAFVQTRAQAFLGAGSVFACHWRERGEALHRDCIARQVSPGGCADLLAAAWFVHRLQLSKR